jgi:uncharacterized BrkB/YihY/UPF0761 family membrane protein
VRRALREVLGLYWESGLAEDVPALSWFVLSSLAPLALGLTALATLVLGDSKEAQALATRAAGVLPKDVHDQIVQLVLRTKQDSPLLIAIAVVGMLWTTSGAVGVIERCLLRLLGAERRGALVGKLRNLGLAGALAVVILLMVIAASAATGIGRDLHIDDTLLRIAGPLIALTLAVVICAVLYRVLGGSALAWPPAFAGGAVAGLVLLLTPTIAGYYLGLVAGRTAVELFLVLAGVLITCYIAAFGLLLGAGIAVRAQRGRPL